MYYYYIAISLSATFRTTTEEPKRKRGAQAGNTNAYKGGPANPFKDVDMSTMATSMKTGKTLGDRLSGKLQGLMDIGQKYRARTPR